MEAEGTNLEKSLQSKSTTCAERVVLNVGGTRFETYISTLTKYPTSLLGAMFHERNSSILKRDEHGEYFFDRSPALFEAVINFYRTGKMRQVQGFSLSRITEEIDYWQLPIDALHDEEKLGNKFGFLAMEGVRKKAEPVLSKISLFILERIETAAQEGTQSFSIEFKESQDHEFYAFLSNFSNRELLLHDLLADNFDVTFNDMTSGQGHSYILFITLWNRYTRRQYDSSTASISKILDELRQGVEVKTVKDDHILTVKPIFL